MTNPPVAPDIKAVVKSMPPFNQLAPHLLDTVERHATILTAAAGKVLAKPTETFHSLVYILEGELHACWEMPDGKNVISAVLGKGQTLGWLSVVDNRPVQHSILAATSVKLLLIPLQVAKQIVFQVPSVTEFVMRQMAETIRRLEIQKRILGMPNAFQRVYVHLLQQVGTSGELRLHKQHEIASFVNTSRETVSRAVQLLVKHGVIRKDGRVIRVQKIDLLKEAAESGTDALEAAT